MKKWLAVFSLYFLLIAGNDICNSQTPKINTDAHVIKFNFGAEKSFLESGVFNVNENSEYGIKNGYGLVDTECKKYDSFPRGDIHDMKIYTGLSSEEKIVFKTDLAPGSYWFEVFMDGGKFTNWRGSFKVNGQTIVDNLIPFHVSFEGDDPPEYWTFFRFIENKEKSIIIEIDAENQPSTLAALYIYRNNVGPVVLKNNTFIAQNSLFAPNAELALRLINNGAISEAKRVIYAMPDIFRHEKAALLLAIAGRLECEDSRSVVEMALALLKEEVINNNSADLFLEMRLAELFVEGDLYYNMAGWDWAGELSGQGIFTRIDLAGMNYEKISQINTFPLNPQALFRMGKVAYWSYIEQHNSVMISFADSIFNNLKKIYPDNNLLKMYSGEQIPWESNAEKVTGDVPNWVNNSVKALSGIKEIIHYWVDNRQAENGEFGGKYDDDVEMLRWWSIAVLANDDKKTLSGMQKLVDGIWGSYWIINGFSRKLRDVEHSSEPVADTQPMMIGLDYGNPVYVERCMTSIKGLDIWTAKNSNGHTHFKSSWYSYKEIDSRPPRDCDVQMNTRTVKAVRWLAWYNKHPLAMKFLKEWGDSWLEDCLRTDKGKPYGIVPAAIRFEDDAIGGHADNWHHPGMFWSYYDYQGGTSMLQQFLVSYILFKDEKYLEPLEASLKLVEKYKNINTNDAETGTEEWVAQILKNSEGFANTAELWRNITGKDRYDQLLKDIGSDYLKFRLTNDFNYLNQGSQHIVDATFFNRELNTTEAYFTDRVEIRNLRGGPEYGANHLESMYAGSPLYDSFYPFYSITWNGFDENFAAVVLAANSREIKVEAYNISDQQKTGSISFWNLEPGTYKIIQGDDLNADQVFDKDISEQTIHISERGTTYILHLPAKKLQLISVKQTAKDANIEKAALADLAVTDKDIRVEFQDDRYKIIVPVHNIGIADAVNTSVKLITHNSNDTKILEQKMIDQISAPLDLNAKIVTVEFTVKKEGTILSNLEIVVDAENRIPEINEQNNSVSLTLN